MDRIESNFEINFRNDCKKLRYKKYQICKLLGITMPTLKTKIETPEKFTWREIIILENEDFEMIKNLSAHSFFNNQ